MPTPYPFTPSIFTTRCATYSCLNPSQSPAACHLHPTRSPNCLPPRSPLPTFSTLSIMPTTQPFAPLIPAAHHLHPLDYLTICHLNPHCPPSHHGPLCHLNPQLPPPLTGHSTCLTHLSNPLLDTNWHQIRVCLNCYIYFICWNFTGKNFLLKIL